MFNLQQIKGTIENVNGVNFELIIPRQEIEARFIELAQQIKDDYVFIKSEEPPLLLIENLMGGSFTSKDLARAMNLVGAPYNMDAVDFKRFEADEHGSEELRVYKNPSASPLKDRHALIIEDVIELGITLKFAKNFLKAWKFKSIKILALGWKKTMSPKFKVDYCGFELPKEWLIGEGMDNNQLERGRLGIWRKITL